MSTDENITDVPDDATQSRRAAALAPEASGAWDSGALASEFVRLMPKSVIRNLELKLSKHNLPMDESNPEALLIIEKTYNAYVKKRESSRLLAAKKRLAARGFTSSEAKASSARQPDDDDVKLDSCRADGMNVPELVKHVKPDAKAKKIVNPDSCRADKALALELVKPDTAIALAQLLNF